VLDELKLSGTRDGVLEAIMERLAEETALQDSFVTDLLPVISALEGISDSVTACRAQVLASNLLSRHVSAAPWGAVEAIIDRVRKRWESIDIGWTRIDVGFVDWPPFLRQTVKTHFSSNGELSHGIVTQAVQSGI